MMKVKEKMNIKMITNMIISSITELLESFISKQNNTETHTKINNAVNSYLDGLVEKKILTRVHSVKVEKANWQKLYPSFFKRYIARFSYYLIEKNILKTIDISYNNYPTVIKFKWYHFILPFKRIITSDRPTEDVLKLWWYSDNTNEKDNASSEVIDQFWESNTPPISWIMKYSEPIFHLKVYIDNPLNYINIKRIY